MLFWLFRHLPTPSLPLQTDGPIAILLPKPFLFKKGSFGFSSVRRIRFGFYTKKFVDHLHVDFWASRLKIAFESGIFIFLSDQSENSGFGYVHRALL